MSIRKNGMGGPGWHVLNDDGREVAWVYDQSKADGEHNEQRARLYDAAEELLEALELGMKLQKPGDIWSVNPHQMKQFLSAAEKAIAKAKQQ